MATVDPVQEREELRAEFAQLQALERALDSYGSALGVSAGVGAPGTDAAPVSDELAAVYTEAAAKAFADYDLNKNGAIELNELAYLCAELGVPMDAKELDATLKALTPSANGKVTAAEWRAFWFGERQQSVAAASARDALNLALLRARLWQHKGAQLVAAIGKRKGVHFPDAQALDTKDAKTHTWSVSVGEFDAPKASLRYRAHHNLVLDPELAAAATAGGRAYNVYYSVDLRHTGKADFPAYVADVLKSVANGTRDAFTSSVSTPRRDLVRVTVGLRLPLPAEPQEMLERYGINPELLARFPRFDVEFGHTPGEVFGKDKPTLADVMKFRARMHLHIEHAMVASTTAALRAQRGNRDAQEAAHLLPFLGAVDTSFRFTAGDVPEVVASLAEYVRTKFGDNSAQMRDLRPFATSVQDLFVKYAAKEVQRDRKREFPIALSMCKAMLLTLERDIAEITQISAWTPSGLGATVELDGVLKSQDLVAAINFAETAAAEVYGNARPNAGPAVGAGAGAGSKPI